MKKTTKKTAKRRPTKTTRFDVEAFREPFKDLLKVEDTKPKTIQDLIKERQLEKPESMRRVIVWPSNWWQHFKQDVLFKFTPKWLRERFPVKHDKCVYWEAPVDNEVAEKVNSLYAGEE